MYEGLHTKSWDMTHIFFTQHQHAAKSSYGFWEMIPQGF